MSELSKENDEKFANSKFLEVHAKHVAAAKKLLVDYTSSSSDENDDDEVDETQILCNLYKNYDSKDVEDKDKSLAKTLGFLENILHSGATTCLICIGNIKKTSAIWSCRYCYCILHLECIRRWAGDSMAKYRTQLNGGQVQQQQRPQPYYNNLGQYVVPKKAKPLHWCCPQCRQEYLPKDKPTAYLCFCGKQLNPELQTWLVPHSCGEICNKPLQPDCGHKCTLLCHPGPCPPCAQYALASCQCGKSPAKSFRCIDKSWQCQRKCERVLACGLHICAKLCHKIDECPPCRKTSQQACACGRETRLQQCFELRWQCKQVCNKMYECGQHKCKEICHADACGPCPLSLPRCCPCGKTKKEGPCSQTIDTCGDTCQKILSCGRHTCTQRCHNGDCNKCLTIVKKKCRCDLHEKELPCYKEFICETKCKRIRDCGKHTCNRKCCDGNCPSCDKPCNKPLSCGKHKCQSVCHNGPCYPCQLTSQRKCHCGKTSKSVPCGRERTARVICLEECRIPYKCHHYNKHRCHKHECPPCNQPCNLPNDTTNCGHICKAKCHAAVKFSKEFTIGDIPSIEHTKKFEFRKLPHPPCEIKISVPCVGGHIISEQPCWNSKSKPCERLCNRQLPCGNHFCQLLCHTVANIDDMKAQDNCIKCEEDCKIPPAKGCIHKCLSKCHPPPCKPCTNIIKSKCHCGLMTLSIKCSEYCADVGTDEDIRNHQEYLMSCANRCWKKYTCGHQCKAKCHSGPCINIEGCTKKIRIFCKCKRLKLDVACERYCNGFTKLECNNQCMEVEKISQLQTLKENEFKRQQEAERDRIELAQYEKKFNKRRYKDTKNKDNQSNTIDSNRRVINWPLLITYLCVIIAICLAIALAFSKE